jgi:hypothetical protein
VVVVPARVRGAFAEPSGRKADAISDYRKALLLDHTNNNATAGLMHLGAPPF